MMFPIKATKTKGLKILTPKQMIQRLEIALAQLNEIIQIIYYLYWAKDIIIKKVHNNKMNSIKV